MNKMALQLGLIVSLLITSCNLNNKKTIEDSLGNNPKAESLDLEHTSEQSLDWYGTYKAIIPCADCEGIKTTITLHKDATYEMEEVYLGKNDKVFISQGTFKWRADGQEITLSDTDRPNYFVGENTLFQLDVSGNKITGHLADKYTLVKNSIAFTNTKWKLVKIMGQEVDNEKAFILFATEENHVFGNNSCNNFTGSFELKEGNRIVLSKLASTMMACPNMEIENQFMSILKKVDNFSLSGNQMTLNKARMAPLAVFVAVE
ncbi:hypothetical protein APS56_10290 [Pseudalgibacter alginicilyticus]|uniref:DUF306 domain-containing protein n=1 Tax=Pseudalgibacter alginicilyticus TaxID=1736674 RepID=A0A0P0CXZ8_9FLAO|nr:copper resistance protein NlpE N-terminal domain-containing protein [Pseudalgibacter alginicilyticus]ALJ05482.1 hypothetical protein APS56_10290 [Pseudalgibacter alginicilyticus]